MYARIHTHDTHTLYYILLFTHVPKSLVISWCRYLDLIERAIANGDCLLLENIGESVDPVLDPLLGRITIKKGRCLKIGDKEIEYHPKFRLILQVSGVLCSDVP